MLNSFIEDLDLENVILVYTFLDIRLVRFCDLIDPVDALQTVCYLSSCCTVCVPDIAITNHCE